MRGLKQAVREAGYHMREASTTAAIGSLDVPIFIAVGDRDQHLPGAQHAGKLASLKEGPKCRFVEVPGAAHLSIYRRRWPGLDEAILEFCRSVSAGEIRSHRPAVAGR